MRQVKKCCLGLFFVANPKQLPLQKQANRTVHPLKIGDALMTVCVFRHVLKTPPFFVPKAQSLASKLAYKLMFFGIRCKSLFLGALGSVWRSNLGFSWRARWRTRPPKIVFFLRPRQRPNVFLLSDGLWSCFWAVFGSLFWIS